ncbi:tetratricopeptide repeat protein [Candidatus Margulisiibacteriota bacterium]
MLYRKIIPGLLRGPEKIAFKKASLDNIKVSNEKTSCGQNAVLGEAGKSKVDVYLNIAQDYSKVQEYKNAINIYQQVLNIDPENEEASFELGYLYCRNREVKKGRALLNQMAGKVWFFSGKVKKGRTLLEKVVKKGGPLAKKAEEILGGFRYLHSSYSGAGGIGIASEIRDMYYCVDWEKDHKGH